MIRILWGITGSGDRLDGVLSAMLSLHQMKGIKVYVVLSKAAEQVWRRYGLWDELNTQFKKVTRETNSNVPFVAGALQIGHYDVFVIAPLTANSTAKIAYGIADTLVTNAVAQTLKGSTPVVLYPVDQKLGEVEIKAPDGTTFTIRTRQIDLDNAERLRNMEGVTVVSSPNEIPDTVKQLIKLG
ncbi:MAG: archaeoflavoprotein AfpA [Candidatus Thorarchaeota archaeon]|nr:archaeoflavoprotein AfpA [Candidatus Thorarchaeota archaeon]MCK5238827.1 archaeoflavoprotein AfpA [Candidatus Thorarchaeota archaeon]